MKREFLGSSKKEPADSRTIRKSTREESIDTLQAASKDSVNQKMIENVHHQSIATVGVENGCDEVNVQIPEEENEKPSSTNTFSK